MTTFLLFLIVATVYQSTTHVSASYERPFKLFDTTNYTHSLFSSEVYQPSRRHHRTRKDNIPSLISADSSSESSDDMPELLHENNTSVDEALSTSDPTSKPTNTPTHKPTDNPTYKPTQHPTKKPTQRRTRKPTKQPTRKPTKRPTAKPTKHPTHYPTTTKPTEAWDSPPQNGKSKPNKPKPAKDDSMSDDALLRVLNDRHTIKKKASNHTSIKIYSFQNHSNTPLLIKFQNEMIAQHSADLILVNGFKFVDPKWIDRAKRLSASNVRMPSRIHAYYGDVYQFALYLHSFIDIVIQFGQQTAQFIKHLNRWFQGVIRQFQLIPELRLVFDLTMSTIQQKDTLLKTVNQRHLFDKIQKAFAGNPNRFDLLHVRGLDVVHLILSFYEYSSPFTVGLFTNWNAYGLRKVTPDPELCFSEVKQWTEIYLTQLTEFVNTLKHKRFDQYKNYSTQHQQLKQTFATLFGLLSPYLIAETIYTYTLDNITIRNSYRNMHIICTNEVDTTKLKTLLGHIQAAKGVQLTIDHFLVTQNKVRKGQKTLFDLTMIAKDKKKRKQSTVHPTQSPTSNDTQLKNDRNGVIKLYLSPPVSSQLFVTELFTQQKNDFVIIDDVDHIMAREYVQRTRVYMDPFWCHIREFFLLHKKRHITPKQWFKTLARQCTQYGSYIYSPSRFIQTAVWNVRQTYRIQTTEQENVLRYMSDFAHNITSFNFDTIPKALWSDEGSVSILIAI
eukprot:799521_1